MTGYGPGRVVEVTVPMAPPRELLPNARRKSRHWSEQSDPTAELRSAAKHAAVSQRNTCGGGPIFREPVIVSYRVVWPWYRYKAALRIPDADAVPTACKAILDGLVDAGMIPDDTPEWVVEVRGRSERGDVGEQGFVIVRLEAA